MEVTHDPWAHFPGKTAWRVRWRCHATWNSRSVGYPHHSLQVDTCRIRTHAGRPRRLSRPSVFCKICKSAAFQSRQSCILPLDHWCLWKIFGLDSYRLQIPCTPFSSSLHDTTFSRQSTPHFVALFQPPVRNPQETLGNPHSCSGNPEVTPSKCLHTPFAPLPGFHPASRVSFLGADASTSAQYWTEVTHNPWAHFPGKTAWRVRWRRHATWNSRSVGYPHHSLQVDICGIQTRARRPHRLSRPMP